MRTDIFPFWRPELYAASIGKLDRDLGMLAELVNEEAVASSRLGLNGLVECLRDDRREPRSPFALKLEGAMEQAMGIFDYLGPHSVFRIPRSDAMLELKWVRRGVKLCDDIGVAFGGEESIVLSEGDQRLTLARKRVVDRTALEEALGEHDLFANAVREGRLVKHKVGWFCQGYQTSEFVAYASSPVAFERLVSLLPLHWGDVS